MQANQHARWIYRGYEVTRTPSSGMWVTWGTGFGYLKADTKAGMREIIRHYAGTARGPWSA